MAKQLQLTIPEPCHENWEAMTPVDKGRFCGACQKQVVDFSTMSDRQVAEFFKKPSTGSVCGRFMSDQLGRDIEIPKKRMPWVKQFFTIALPAFLFSIKPNTAKAQGEIKVTTTSKNKQQKRRFMGAPAVIKQDKPLMGDTLVMEEVVVQSLSKPAQSVATYNCPEINGPLANFLNGKYSCCFVPQKPIEQTIDIAKVKDLSISSLQVRNNLPLAAKGKVIIDQDTARMITGVIIDENGDLLPGASVVIKGTNTGTICDSNGYFKIRAKSNDILVATYIGMEKTEMTIGLRNEISMVLHQVMFTGMTVGAIVTTVRKKKQKETPLIPSISNNTSENPIKIFPNPVTSGSLLTIEFKKGDEALYSVQLLNQSGQSIHQQQISVERKARQVQVTLPQVPAGSYFLVLVNTETGKRFSETIIIN